MAVDIKNTSRLRLADLKLIDGIEFWDTLDLPTYTPRNSDIVHRVMDSERIDLIAYRYYQDPVLWWVIAWANDIEIIPSDLRVGQQLIIPDPVFVNTELLPGKYRKVL